MPTTLQNDAGIRRLPPKSEPVANGAISQAKAAAEPAFRRGSAPPTQPGTYSRLLPERSRLVSAKLWCSAPPSAPRGGLSHDELLHKSVHEALVEIRLNNAQHFLEHGHKSMTDIAALCGFCNAPHFSRSFKSKYRLSPLKYRKQSCLI